MCAFEKRENAGDRHNARAKTHKQGGILVDSRQRTNVEGIFAAGDCTCSSAFNLTSCLGDGVKAGLAAHLYVKRLKKIRR